MFALVKLILNFFSGEPKIPFFPKVGRKLNIKKLFLGFSACDDELPSTPKIITFLALLLQKHHQSALLNVIPYLLYIYISLSLFFTILVSPNKQLLNPKLLVGFFGQSYNS